MVRTLIITLLFPLLTACEVIEWKDRILSTIVDQIPYQFEQSLGERLLPSVLPPETRLNDPQAEQELRKLLSPLLQKAPDLQIKLFISKDPKLNAFAIPGGYLVFNRGMLTAAETPEEILGVAAHEIAHVKLRHSMRSMIQGLGLFAIVTFFFGDLQGIAAYLIDQAHILLRNGFSRVQERESDSIGFDLLVSANIDPRGMNRFFERLSKGDSSDSPGPLGAFLSTHPLTQDRIQSIQSRYEALPAAKKAGFRRQTFDLSRLQAQIRGN